VRIVYLTIDNVNDNVILAQTLPFLGRLTTLPGVEGIDLFALRKGGGERYRACLSALIQTHVEDNHGIWHPLTLLRLLELARRAWICARGGALLIGRNPVGLLCLVPAACRRQTRLVLDYRGILSEEYALQGKIARRGRMHRLLRGLEGWALGRADAILCVSERLRRRSLRWRPATGPIFVVPCCYDPAILGEDEAAVGTLRRELGLDPERDFVLVYSGSLSAWNRPEAIRDVYRAFREACPGARLLLLTGDLTRARTIFAEEAGVIIRAVPHEAIQNYLALGDLGLLLRAPHPVNRVACPVKFAEYLVSGLPVLVSRGVGDCPDIVRQARVGYVLEDTPLLAQVVAEVRAQRPELRRRCREAALRRFDGESFRAVYAEILTGELGAMDRDGSRDKHASGMCPEE
jgi:glycosyltransferase involved in cell wall biosynthesis